MTRFQWFKFRRTHVELIRTNRVITAKVIAEVGFMLLEISNDLE
ncbi:MAG: hypothetical protein AB4372_17415 [Xenococcus sp. (in: cyanobacteria)]